MQYSGWISTWSLACQYDPAGFSKTSRPPSETISVRHFFFSAKNCKLAKVARQVATIDFFNLFPFFLSPGSFYFSFPIPLLVCLVWFSRLSGRKKLHFGIFSLKYLSAYVAKLVFKNSAQYTAQWFQLAAKCKNEYTLEHFRQFNSFFWTLMKVRKKNQKNPFTWQWKWQKCDFLELILYSQVNDS